MSVESWQSGVGRNLGSTRIWVGRWVALELKVSLVSWFLLRLLLSGQKGRQQQQICANVNEEGHNNGNYDDIDKAKGGIIKQKVQ